MSRPFRASPPLPPGSVPPGSPDPAGRGASVPFETPSLFAARVRADRRHGLAMLLRDFAANAAIHVLPWHSVPSVIPMTGRDKMLHRVIADRRATTPRLVRDAVRETATSGVSGAEAASVATRQAAEDRARAALLQALVLARVAGEPALEPGPGARTLLRAVAARLGLDAATLFDRAGLLAGELLAVGVADGPAEATGPLRALQTELESFAQYLRARAETAPPDARPHVRRACAAATATVAEGAEALAGLDALLKDLPTMVGAWPAARPALKGRIDRLDWLLDGWEQTLEDYARRMTGWLTASHERTMATLVALTPAAGETERGLAMVR